MLLQATALQNPHQPLLKAPCLWIVEDKIRWLGQLSALPPEAKQDSEILELHNTLLLPGMVNAHAHLELSHLEGFPYAGSFVAWIQALLDAKQKNPQIKNQAFIKGLRETLLGGATCLGDHASIESDLADLLNSPLRVKIFVEILGIKRETAEDIFLAASKLRQKYSNPEALHEVIPSPHSVHALHPEVLKKVLSENAEVFSIHLAESEVEELYFKKNAGPMHEFILSRSKASTERSLTSSGIKQLAAIKKLNSKILAVHANYLDDEEIQLLAENQMSIVHCPLSHRYFSHQSFRMQDCLDAGINVALGSDSLSSAASLAMFDILRATSESFPFLSRENIFEMASLGGAKALKMEDKIGSLVAGKKADLIGINYLAHTDPWKALWDTKQANFSMINGVKVEI